MSKVLRYAVPRLDNVLRYVAKHEKVEVIDTMRDTMGFRAIEYPVVKFSLWDEFPKVWTTHLRDDMERMEDVLWHLHGKAGLVVSNVDPRSPDHHGERTSRNFRFYPTPININLWNEYEEDDKQ